MPLPSIAAPGPGASSTLEERTAPAASLAASPAASIDRCDFDLVYRRWYSDVVRWCRALGGPEMDLEDLAQEVFMVVRRKLSAFDGRNLPGWLYTVTTLAVRRHRRRAWLRNLFLRGTPPEAEAEQPGAERAGSERPDAVIDRRDRVRLLNRLLGRLSAPQRAAFLLFEAEGYSIEQIAAIQEVPASTVSTRIFYGRKKLARELARLRKAGAVG